MNKYDFFKVVELITNSNISYIELKTDSLHIKALKEDCNKKFYSNLKIGDEICCTKEKSSIIQIKSLYVGVINIFKGETSDEYIKAGSKVKKGQILGSIMFLKIPINVVSPIDGIVTEVLAKNNEIVEYGQVLFKIKKI
ncbi:MULTISPECIES: acetyl-CoA carboxylase biotin carboxyl carrier protein [Clostridium]|uniref:acetyl-CoA carboxylase biotin carboxyl carrier protein n=1 Tax=Clostridium TaxID=1485 RepID=UPI00082634AD|nr:MULTISPECIES: biotin/lipoyl-containing protein [Clostridium]PJI09256.1 acetyl-CoA carboxylase biotin carboxyl carrier protein subunit [Clostridium sp. CT7]